MSVKPRQAHHRRPSTLAAGEARRDVIVALLLAPFLPPRTSVGAHASRCNLPCGVLIMPLGGQQLPPVPNGLRGLPVVLASQPASLAGESRLPRHPRIAGRDDGLIRE